jgi:uncharacterized membrane protein
MSEASIQLLVAAFDGETAAEEALKTLKESQDEKLVGIQAAVAMHKDQEGQIHFKDVGLTPAKGAAGGVALGVVVGVLTGGTGLALGALGALVGGLVGKKKRDSRFSADRINQVAASLAPGSSAIVIAMEPGWVVVLEEELQRLGADVLKVEIPADLAQQLEANEEAAHSMLADRVGAALTDPEKEEEGS